MSSITVTVNGRRITSDVPPRQHLADFLRETNGLTGTHLGCEHGVCGACTIELDGQISRSCITYAIACDGGDVRTIEGFDADPLMARLRAAFSAEHALQCGYCTPGMLIAARDLIKRRGALPEAEIRTEMSGNLCRCTGYAGIVKAIARVMADVEPLPAMAATDRSRQAWLGPMPGPAAPAATSTLPPAPHATPPTTPSAAPPAATPPRQHRPIAIQTTPVRAIGGFNELTQSFSLPHPRAAIWPHLSDLASTMSCVPGASLDGPVGDDGAFTARITVALGPIRTSFGGTGVFVADAPTWSCRVEGRGQDEHGPSAARGLLSYRLIDDGDASTRIVADIKYALTGPLAQFGRPALVHGLVSGLGETFAANVLDRVEGRAIGQDRPRNDFSVLTFLWRLIKRAGARIMGQNA